MTEWSLAAAGQLSQASAVGANQTMPPDAVTGSSGKRARDGTARPVTAPSRASPLPILDGLGELGGGDVVGAREVGDGPRKLEHSVIASRRELELLGRRLQEALSGRGETAVLPDLLWTQLGVGAEPGPPEPRSLPLSCLLDPL